MSEVTIICDCGYCTDISLISETNPRRCSKCGGELKISGTDDPVYVDGEYNPVLFSDKDAE